MAANAKEYKDLQQAASIADDALVATAEPNATELQTSTVTALAQKIQEINTDGPLAELELATSIGKQQLAEALTEKGVPTTANETEIQMADKVRALVTNNAMNFSKGTLTYNYKSNISIADVAKYAEIVRIKSYVFFATDSKIYAIPDGTYDTLAQMVASAVAEISVQTPATASPVRLGRSIDGNTLVYSWGVNKSIEIYDVNWTGASPVISFVKAVIPPTNLRSGYGWNPGISNDRELMSYAEINGNYINFFLVNDPTVYTYGNSTPSLSSSYQNSVYIDAENGKVYSCSTYTTVFVISGLSYEPTTEGKQGSIAVEAGTPPNLPTSIIPSASIQSSYIDFDSGLVVRVYATYTSSSTTIDNLSAVQWLSIINLKNLEIPEFTSKFLFFKPNFVNNMQKGSTNYYSSMTNASSLSVGIPLGMTHFPIREVAGGKYTLDIPTYEGDLITYDRSSGTYSRAKNSVNGHHQNSTSDMTIGKFLCKSSTGYLGLWVQDNYLRSVDIEVEDVITMINLNFNSTPISVPLLYIDSYKLNGLKTETVSVPLPEESQSQEAN